MGVILHAHPIRGESHIQHNTNGEVATIQAVHTKTTRSHMALHRNISGAVNTRNLFKGSKDLARLVVCSEKKFVSDCRFFVCDVISGILLGHCGPLHLALGSNH